MSESRKRSSPGADPILKTLDFELSDEDAQKLDDIGKKAARLELQLDRHAALEMQKHYESRRPILRTIPHFWQVALNRHPLIQEYATSAQDQDALSFLEEIWLVRDPVEHRAFTIEFHFKENPYFSDKFLTKEYKLKPAQKGEDNKPDAEGISQAMLDFDPQDDLEPQAIKIQWKDDAHNLTKLRPHKEGEEVDDEAPDHGSFFNWFEVEKDFFDVGGIILSDIYPEAHDWFTGTHVEIVDEEVESDEEDDDSNEEDIDLEKPAKKRRT